MAEAQTSIGIQREAPFLEDYRRRLMDSVFKAGDKAIKPLQREITGFHNTNGFTCFSFGSRTI